MAEIVSRFNTVDKTLLVTIDGKAVDNVMDASFGMSYMEDDEFCCSICTCVKDEANDTRTFTRIMAASDAKAAGVKSTSFPGFVERQVSSLSAAQAHIKQFFTKD